MLTAVDTGDQIAVVAVIVGIATGLIAVAALVVAWKARGDARRSADAAEESARQARRSADAEERAVALSQHEAEQRAANRHKDDGPGFVRVAGYVMDRTAHAELRIIAGPGRVVLDVRADAPWCTGICSSGKGPVGDSITYPPMHPGETFTLTAHLGADPWEGHSRVALPLVIDVESREDPPRTWRRSVEVELMPGPMVAWA